MVEEAVSGATSGAALGPYGAIAGAVISPVVGGLVGRYLSSGDRKEAQARMDEAYRILESIGMPPDLSGPLILQQLRSSGIYVPELEKDLGDIHSEWVNYSADKELVSAQNDALNLFKQKATQQGLTDQDRYLFNQINTDLQQKSEGKRQQIMQDFASRHMGGSGAELANMLMTGQGTSNELSSQGMNIAAQAQRAKSDALSQYGSLASQMRQQSSAEEANKLSNLDAMARFNAQNRRQLQSTNVGLMNQAQLDKLNYDRQMQQYNTQLANQESLRQVNELGNLFDRRANIAGMKANVKSGQAAMYNQRAVDKAQMGYGVGSAIGQGFQAYGNYLQQEKQNKFNEDLLDRMYPKTKPQTPSVSDYAQASNLAHGLTFNNDYSHLYNLGQSQMPYSQQFGINQRNYTPNRNYTSMYDYNF